MLIGIVSAALAFFHITFGDDLLTQVGDEIVWFLNTWAEIVAKLLDAAKRHEGFSFKNSQHVMVSRHIYCVKRGGSRSSGTILVNFELTTARIYLTILPNHLFPKL